MNWLQLILKWAAVALQIITMIETVLPAASGTVKKAVAMAVLAPPAGESAEVGGLVDTIVGALNSTGAFVKK